MAEYEEQEQEFWRKLAEADMSRSQMLKRSVAAAAGLTVLASPGVAAAGRRPGAATPPPKGKSIAMTELVCQAKNEDHHHTRAPPPSPARWGPPGFVARRRTGGPPRPRSMGRRARRSRHSERGVAELVVAAARAVPADVPDAAAQRTAGYYLIGPGRSGLEEALGMSARGLRRRRN